MKTKNYYKTARIACFLAILLFVPACLMAQKPDLSGNWKLNTAASDLMVEMTLAPQTINILLEDNSMTVDKKMDMMGQIYEAREIYTLDGAECKNAGMMNTTKVSKALWNDAGISLWIYSTTDYEGQSFTSTEVYFFNDEGNLVIDMSMQSPMGEMAETYVYDKQ